MKKLSVILSLFIFSCSSGTVSIANISPFNGESDVRVDRVIDLGFSDEIDLDVSSISLKIGDEVVEFELEKIDSSNYIISPVPLFEYSSKYSLTLNNENLIDIFVITFETADLVIATPDGDTPIYSGSYYSGLDVPTSVSSTFKLDIQEHLGGHFSLGYDWSCTEVDYNLPANREGINPVNSTISCYYNLGTTEVQTIYDREATYSLDGITREHTVPKSWMKSSTSSIEGNDLHNLISCNGSANTSRSNKRLDSVNIPDWHKGNAARIHFYMYTRYAGDIWNVNGNDGAMQSGVDIDAEYEDILRQWHKDDPVDFYEMERNNRVYAKQRNRNPFVDHPEWVELVEDF